MIIFKNEGNIDLRAIKTFGLSSKDGETTIGRFGTGLKYATAVILRNGGSMSIWSGGKWHKLETRQETFRDKEILQITMDGQDLPFTTDLGRDWEVWQAFRELYSNALDEGGVVDRADAAPEPSDAEAVIAVEMNAFEAIFFSMEEHFIGQEEDPLWENDKMQVFAGQSKFVFYRGIAIQKLKEPAKYRYNLKGHISLTEDRTAKYAWQVNAAIASGLMSCDNEEITSNAVDQRNPFEVTLDYSDSMTTTKPSDTFIGSSVKAGVNSNPTATAIVRAQLPSDGSTATILQKGAPGAKCLSDALEVLRGIGADLSKAKFVLAEGVQVYSDYDVRGDAIFISDKIFDNQDRMTLAVVHGYADVVGNAWLARTLIKKVQSSNVD